MEKLLSLFTLGVFTLSTHLPVFAEVAEPSAEPELGEITEKTVEVDLSEKETVSPESQGAEIQTRVEDPEPEPEIPVDVPLPKPTPPDPFSFLKGFQGNFETDLFTGSSSFGYPLTLPSGRKGIAPSINLSYSSNNRSFDSIVGFGWSLPTNGIYRSTRKGSEQLYELNDFSADLFGSTQELIAVDSAAGEYQAKIEGGFSKFRFQNNQWNLTDKQGTEYTFGSGENFRQSDPEDASRVYKWMLERVEDRDGNFMTFSYFHESGQAYPDSIRYTQKDSDEGIYEVKFLRTSKPPYTSYKRGFKTVIENLIDRIEVWRYEEATPTEILTYDLNYETRNNAIMLLKSITVRKGAESLPPVQFQYYDGTESEVNKKINLLKRIEFPHGGIRELTYKPSTTYRMENGEFANRVPFIIHTVHESKLQESVGAPIHTTTYEYAGGHYYFDHLDAYKKEWFN